jgi:antitoxin component YwqK of YwqJK toxin-antitoxin module
MTVFSHRWLLRAAWVSTFLVVPGASRALVAQTSTTSGQAATPIYLDEPEVIAEPRVVDHETIKDAYPDGKPRVEREVARFSDNHFEADGIYREYYANGKVFVEGRFIRGRREGEWVFSYDSGQLNRKATYKEGQPDGSWEVFRADGTLSAKRSFKDGQRHGEWLTFDDSGKQKLSEEHYADGKRDGVARVWFPSGKLKQQASFKLGQNHGTATEWNEQGEKVAEFSYEEGKLHGSASRLLPSGRRVEQQFKDGKLVSESK